MFYCLCDTLPEFSALSSTLILGIAGSNIQVRLRLLVTSYINIDILELLIVNNLYTCVVAVTEVFNFMIQRKKSQCHLVEYCEILYGHAFTTCWFVVQKINPLLNFWKQIGIWEIQWQWADYNYNSLAQQWCCMLWNIHQSWWLLT